MIIIIMVTTIIFAKIREAAVAEEDHESVKWGGGGGDSLQAVGVLTVKLENFNAVSIHIARAVPPGSRVCDLYAVVGVLGLMVLSYNYCMSKVEEDDDYDDYGGGGCHTLILLICSN